MGHPVLIRSKRLAIAATQPNDLDFVLAAESDHANAPFLVTWSQIQHEASLGDPNIAHLTIATRGGAEQVGYAIVAGLTNPHHSIEFQRLVIGPKGHGFGREALQCIKDWAFGEQHAHRLWLDVKEGNHRARALYASEGFVVEGTLRECLKTSAGTYESLIVMSMLRAEYDASLTGHRFQPTSKI